MGAELLGLDKKRLDFFIGAVAGKEEDLTNIFFFFGAFAYYG